MIDATRAEQIAEVTIRDKLLELAKQYEERGKLLLATLWNHDPAFAYNYKALCDRMASQYREFVRETFL